MQRFRKFTQIVEFVSILISSPIKKVEASVIKISRSENHEAKGIKFGGELQVITSLRKFNLNSKYIIIIAQLE